MLTRRSHFRRTRRGNVLKVSSEHYLRDDIYCGYSHCTQCPDVPPPGLLAVAVRDGRMPSSHSNRSLPPPSGVSSSGAASSAASAAAAAFRPLARTDSGAAAPILVIDTNIALHQIDLLESAPSLTNVVLLQTVLAEVRARSAQVYSRLRALVADAERCFYVFSNEHHRATYVRRNKGESPNDRNDRAIRVATAWYRDHLADAPVTHQQRAAAIERDHLVVAAGGNAQCLANDGKALRVILVSDDRLNRKAAKEENIEVYSIREFLGNYLPHKAQLLDLVAKPKDEDEQDDDDDDDDNGGKRKRQFSRSGRVPLFPSHLPETKLLAAIKSGKLVQGKFYQDPRNVLQGSVGTGRESGASILISGGVDINRAFDGDIVAVELYPESEWISESTVLIDVDDVAGADPDADDENTTASAAAPGQAGVEGEEKRPRGKVVGIVRRNWRRYCGHLLPRRGDPPSRPSPGNYLFVANASSIPRIRIATSQPASLLGCRLVVAVDSWDRYSRYPSGHYVRVLGSVDDKETENEVLLLEHDISYEPFSQAVLDCLPPNPYVISEQEIRNRVDLRESRVVCSIDPPGCTDIDDALHVQRLENGNYEVGVHIADVSHYVKPGTAIDAEAAARGTTVYLVDRRIDMLPSYLGTDLCSLKPQVDRLAFSVVWELDPDANTVSVNFHKSIIRSVHAFSYGEAQAKIDSDDTGIVAQNLRDLLMLSKKLLARRKKKGALELSSPAVHFELDSETSDPLSTSIYEMRETNSLVEEFMLLANMTVAKQTLGAFPLSALLRRHPAPNPERFEPLINAIKASSHLFDLGDDLVFDVTSNKALATSLNDATSSSNPYLNTLLRIMTSRCMQPAAYFCSGNEDTYDHFGLAAELYTHFTSPIRRYSDVIAHRQLFASLSPSNECHPSLSDKNLLGAITDNLNLRHRNAQYAGRSSVELHTLIFFKDRVVDEDAYVLATKSNGVVVIVPKFGIQGRVTFCKADEPSPLVYDTATQTLNDPATNAVVLAMFQPVRVRISVKTSANLRRFLEVHMLEPDLSVYMDAQGVVAMDVESSSSKKTAAVDVEEGLSLKDVLAEARVGEGGEDPPVVGSKRRPSNDGEGEDEGMTSRKKHKPVKSSAKSKAKGKGKGKGRK